jgi:hypothetical protein
MSEGGASSEIASSAILGQGLQGPSAAILPLKQAGLESFFPRASTSTRAKSANSSTKTKEDKERARKVASTQDALLEETKKKKEGDAKAVAEGKEYHHVDEDGEPLDLVVVTGKKGSYVWGCCKVLNGTQAGANSFTVFCNYCDKKYVSGTDSSTSSISNHMKNKHPTAPLVAEKLAAEAEQQAAAILASAESNSQGKGGGKAAGPLNKFANYEDKLQSVTTSMLRYVVDANEPLSIVTSDPFRRMLREVAPSVPEVGKDRLSAALQRTAKVVRDHLKEIWKGESLSITTGKILCMYGSVCMETDVTEFGT